MGGLSKVIIKKTQVTQVILGVKPDFLRHYGIFRVTEGLSGDLSTSQEIGA